VFIYACLETDGLGLKARGLLRRVEKGELEASTSTLTFDEVAWAVKRHRGLDHAASAGEALVNMVGLQLVPVDENIVRSSITLMRCYSFDPRDSIHAASSIRSGAEAIVSTDQHFDRMERPVRREIKDAL
jgi:predicted nucleic acid-binding protein